MIKMLVGGGNSTTSRQQYLRIGGIKMELINFKGYVFMCDIVDLAESELFIDLIIKNNLITSDKMNKEEIDRIINYEIDNDSVILGDMDLSTLLSEIFTSLDEPYFSKALKLLELNYYGYEKIDIYYIEDKYYIDFMMFR